MNTLATLDLFYKSDDVESTLIKCIYNTLTRREDYPLTETSSRIDFSGYEILIESVEDINKIEDDINKSKSEVNPEKKEKLFKRRYQ